MEEKNVMMHADEADSSDIVSKVWPDLTQDEVCGLLERYPALKGPARILNYSMRPLSAASLVETAGGKVLVKRHAAAIRRGTSLQEEHQLIDHLRAHGLATPAVLRTEDGASAVETVDSAGNAWTYEVIEAAEGSDKYQGRASWTAFDCLEDAYAAGAALAKVHGASASYDGAVRTPAVLTSRPTVFGFAADPEAAFVQRCKDLPGLEQDMSGRSWQKDLARHFALAAAQYEKLKDLPAVWTHNDFHSSNLFWNGNDVASVIDWGLADRCVTVYDLAIAIERNTILWQELLAGDETAVRLDQTKALLEGYESVRKLTEADKAALPGMLPLCQADAALASQSYYVAVLKDSGFAEWGYYSYLLDHTLWFDTPAGQKYLEQFTNLL